jgi:hypothetical protein
VMVPVGNSQEEAQKNRSRTRFTGGFAPGRLCSELIFLVRYRCIQGNYFLGNNWDYRFLTCNSLVRPALTRERKTRFLT